MTSCCDYYVVFVHIIVYSKSSVTTALCKSDEGFEEIQEGGGGGGGCNNRGDDQRRPMRLG